MKITLFYAALLLMLSTGVQAGTVTGDLEVTGDNEGLSTTRVLVGYKEKIAGWDLGIKRGKFTIDSTVGDVEFNDTRFTYHRKFNDRTSVYGYVGSLYNSDWSLVTGEVTLAHRLDKKWYFEGNVEKNLIDSFGAVNGEVAYTGYTGSADYKFTPQLVGVGIYSISHLTDGNDKRAAEGRLIYDIEDVEGLSVQFHRRNTSYDFNPAEYFAPTIWTRNLFGVGYVTGTGQWLFRGKLLTGPQTIEGDSGKFTELKLHLAYDVDKRTTMKVFHERIQSTGADYEYEWKWSGVRIEYRL